MAGAPRPGRGRQDGRSKAQGWLDAGRAASSLTILEEELAEIDAEIDAPVRGSPAWREKEDLIASVPGVGPITARTLIAEMPELGSLHSSGSPASLASPPSPASPASGGAKP